MNSFKKDYKEALQLIQSSHYIVVVTHINPDPDTLSSALALSNYFSNNKINHKVYNLSKNLPLHLSFLPKFHKIVNQFPPKYDLVIYVDCGDQERGAVKLDDNCKIINIDHHQSNNNYGDINIVDSTKGSTAEVLYGFFETNSIKITKDIATCLYVGIYDDTIAFTTPRTNAQTFEVVNHLVTAGIDPSFVAESFIMKDSLAKYRMLPKVLSTLQLHLSAQVATIYQKEEWLESTGASFNECDEVVNDILKIAVVKVALYLREQNNKIRVSLRGKDSDIDLSLVASKFNGGGHQNAAGCTIEYDDIDSAMKEILEVLKSYI